MRGVFTVYGLGALLALAGATLAASAPRTGEEDPGCRACELYGAGGEPVPAELPPAPVPDASHPLRVCADPNNLPFSNQRGEGFENRLAAILAADLGARLETVWWPQRRAFVRNTLRAGACDVLLGVPTSLDSVTTTRPYYRSGYVFLWQADRRLDLASLDDPRLRTLRVGVQLVGDESASSPPAHALATRGIVGNVRGYSVVGDYAEDNPPARIVDAVAHGDVDVAIAWGPLAGYFAAREPVKIAMAPVEPQVDLPFVPMVFDIGIGVRRSDVALREALDAALERRRAEIDALLAEYGVPRVDGGASIVSAPPRGAAGATRAPSAGRGPAATAHTRGQG